MSKVILGLAVDRMETRALWNRLQEELLLLEAQIQGLSDPRGKVERIHRCRRIVCELHMRGTQTSLFAG